MTENTCGCKFVRGFGLMGSLWNISYGLTRSKNLSKTLSRLYLSEQMLTSQFEKGLQVVVMMLMSIHPVACVLSTVFSVFKLIEIKHFLYEFFIGESGRICY